MLDYIEIMLSDYSTYRINADNIIEFEWDVQEELIDMSGFFEQVGDFYDNIPIVQSLLLVIKDCNEIISYDNEKDFDTTRTDITQIVIFNKDEGMTKSAYVDLTSEDNNDNQENYLKEDGTFFIRIDREK